MTHELLVGVLFTEQEFIHLFTKEINTYILNTLYKITWLGDETTKLIQEFTNLIKNDNLHNLSIYLKKYLFDKQHYFISHIIFDRFFYINKSILINNDVFYPLKHINNFIIKRIVIENSNRNIEYFIGYEHKFTCNRYFKISDLGFDKDLLLKSLSNHNKLLKLKNINININILNIINSYITISLKNIKIETIINTL